MTNQNTTSCSKSKHSRPEPRERHKGNIATVSRGLVLKAKPSFERKFQRFILVTIASDTIVAAKFRVAVTRSVNVGTSGQKFAGKRKKTEGICQPVMRGKSNKLVN